MEYMYTHPGGYGNEQNPEPPRLRNKDCTIEKRYPHKAHRHDLHPEWYRLFLLKVLYIRAKMSVRHQPIIKPPGAAQIKGCRQQKKRCCRQHRQKDSCHTQCKRQASQKRQNIFHPVIFKLFRPLRY